VSKFKDGDKVYIRLEGGGYTSYEEYLVDNIEGVEVWLEDYECPFDATTGVRLGLPPFPGWRCTLATKDEVPEGADVLYRHDR
jgi:hypothetical protein